jgi:hypothetical protein
MASHRRTLKGLREWLDLYNDRCGFTGVADLWIWHGHASVIEELV